jgi:hypothetical protein
MPTMDLARKWSMGCLTAVGLRIVLVGCLLASATTVISAWRNLWFAFGGVTADGRVVRQVEELAANWDDPSAAKKASGLQLAPARRLYRAIVEFEIGENTYSVAAQASGPVHIYPVGSHLDVVFARGRPESAKLRAELPDFWIQAGFLLIGTVLGAAAVYWWWKLISRRGRINPLSDGRTNVSGG